MTTPSELSLQPIVDVPMQARCSAQYLICVDLRPEASSDAWPRESEEVAFTCLLETLPLFTHQRLGDPMLIVHRFGGTYGPVRFLLTACDAAASGSIAVTFVDERGVPVHHVSIPNIRVEPGHDRGSRATLPRLRKRSVRSTAVRPSRPSGPAFSDDPVARGSATALTASLPTESTPSREPPAPPERKPAADESRELSAESQPPAPAPNPSEPEWPRNEPPTITPSTLDPRRDPRSKVITVTVRYKSVDDVEEFIERHAGDVARRGMFIQTATPFALQTLVKFDVRLAAEQRVLQGVGRIVWKRESAESSASRPAGMGMKFIKLDDESRRVVEQLVAARGANPSTYDDGFDAAPPSPSNAPSEQASTPVPSVPAPAPPKVAPDQDEWFAGINGVPVGPLPLAELRKRFVQGHITRESLVWRDGLEEWQPLRTFPELVQALLGGETITGAGASLSVSPRVVEAVGGHGAPPGQLRFFCPACRAKYQISRDKVEGRSVRMKCRKCGTLMQLSSGSPPAAPWAGSAARSAPPSSVQEGHRARSDDAPLAPATRRAEPLLPDQLAPSPTELPRLPAQLATLEDTPTSFWRSTFSRRSKALRAAEALLEQKEYERALEAYRDLVANQKDDVRSWLVIGDIEAARGSQRAAVEAYQRAATLYMGKNEREKALTVYRRMHEVAVQGPAEEGLRRYLAGVAAEIHADFGHTGSALIMLRDFVGEIDHHPPHPHAMAVLKKLIQRDRRHPAAYLFLAELSRNAGDVSAAVEAYRNAAELLVESGYAQHALRTLEAGLALAPDPNAALRATQLHLERGTQEHALEALRKLVICVDSGAKDLELISPLSTAIALVGDAPEAHELCRAMADATGGDAQREDLYAVLSQYLGR